MLDILQTRRPWYQKIWTWLVASGTAFGLYHNAQLIVDAAPALFPYDFAKNIPNSSAQRHDQVMQLVFTDWAVSKERLDQSLGTAFSRTTTTGNAGRILDGYYYETDFSYLYTLFAESQMIAFIYLQKRAVPTAMQKYLKAKNIDANDTDFKQLVEAFKVNEGVQSGINQLAVITNFSSDTAGIMFEFVKALNCRQAADGTSMLSDLVCGTDAGRAHFLLAGATHIAFSNYSYKPSKDRQSELIEMYVSFMQSSTGSRILTAVKTAPAGAKE